MFRPKFPCARFFQEVCHGHSDLRIGVNKPLVEATDPQTTPDLLHGSGLWPRGDEGNFIRLGRDPLELTKKPQNLIVGAAKRHL